MVALNKLACTRNSQVYSVGPKTPVTPGTSLSNGILPQFLKFSLIFMNMQMM